MTTPAAPQMTAQRLKDASGWLVLVQWTDRPHQHVHEFETEDEAQRWIEHDSAAWLAKMGPT